MHPLFLLLFTFLFQCCCMVRRVRGHVGLHGVDVPKQLLEKMFNWILTQVKERGMISEPVSLNGTRKTTLQSQCILLCTKCKLF